MRQPQHPGIILQGIISRSNLTQEEAAEKFRLGVEELSALCTGRASVTPEIASNLASALDMSAQAWTEMQNNHDRTR